MFENLNYAIVQLAHNFGAAAVVALPILALYAAVEAGPIRHRFAWLVGLGWAVQVISGMGFGAVSYYYYEKLPDLHGIAFAALLIKILCAAGGLGIAMLYVRRAADWTAQRRRAAWKLLGSLGITALAGAAFLRWFA
ncbi:hypothetical protein [Nitrosovibrio sp. Nv6]|uniref:hypothetical protein n=1 Tax=Nitrosovibrio sp. Nv6 TaxID=1855340 RepID=UPI0008D3F5FA|nr:hypothetical protein [Nitrosovibrio sp. Nv6]SEO60520.1 hypothetical protein SAMN05216316_0598 [Nitrosovibrio sp. Nv6]